MNLYRGIKEEFISKRREFKEEKEKSKRIEHENKLKHE